MCFSGIQIYFACFIVNNRQFGFEMDKLACRYHPDAPLVEDDHAGDVICSECGLVVGDRIIDVGCEWRVFSDDTKKDPSRVGGPENLLLNGSDLSTTIGPATGQASFNEFGLPKYYNRKTTSSSDRILIKAFKEIAVMADRINVPKSIVDKANFLFKQVHDGGRLKNRSSELTASACLYIACRTDGAPRSFKEISAVSNFNKREIGRCYLLISKFLESDFGVIESEDFMSRFCAKLALSHAVQRAATHIARKAEHMDIVGGKCPITIAAAAIYMASQVSKDKKNQKEIGEISGVSTAAINSSYKQMLPFAADLFPVDFH